MPLRLWDAAQAEHGDDAVDGPRRDIPIPLLAAPAAAVRRKSRRQILDAHRHDLVHVLQPRRLDSSA